MRTFLEEDVKLSGHLQIAKVYSDGTEELVFDDHNVIVSGMGVGLSYLFTAGGSDNLLDFQIDRFQVGVSGGTALEVIWSITIRRCVWNKQ